MGKCFADGCNYGIWSHKFCKKHQNLRKDPKWLATLAKAAEKRAKPISKVSAKKLAANNGNAWKAGKIRKYSAEYQKEVDKYNKRGPVYLEENPDCMFPECKCQSQQIHHKKSRGKYLNDESTWIALCIPHHEWAEAHGKEARGINVSTSRLAKDDR